VFVQERIIRHPLGQFVICLERLGDSVSSVDPDGEPSDPAASPVKMVLGNSIRIPPFGEGLHGLCSGCGIGLVQEAAVSMMGVDDAPVVGVRQIRGAMPTETLETPPVPSRLFCGLFRIKVAKSHGHSFSYAVSLLPRSGVQKTGAQFFGPVHLLGHRRFGLGCPAACQDEIDGLAGLRAGLEDVGRVILHGLAWRISAWLGIVSFLSSWMRFGTTRRRVSVFVPRRGLWREKIQ